MTTRGKSSVSPDDVSQGLSRRGLLGMLASATAGVTRAAFASSSRLAIPGLYPGRVVRVQHASSIAGGVIQAGPIADVMRRGMRELTGAPDWTSAWQQFFSPGEIVGIKLNGTGRPGAISSREVVNQVIDGLTSAGIRLADIVVYDRYRSDFLGAGFNTWLPEGVRTAWAAPAYDGVQQSIQGYDEAHYVDLPLVLPGQSVSDPIATRSHAATFITQQVDKLVNVAALKDHQAAGVTLCLKNLSHGLANNAVRSHPTTTSSACHVYIPAVVSLPVIRNKAVLHILDGIKGIFHGGPGCNNEFVWEHRAVYFGTDPVAVDRIGWKEIDRKRLAFGMLSVADAPADRYSSYPNRQPEHIELAGAVGLGISDEGKIDLRAIQLA